MIIDYTKGYEEAINRGILYLQTNPLYDKPHIRLNEKVNKIEGITFLNFPLLEGEELSLIGCSFENCGKVVLNDCEMEYCIFGCVDSLDFDDCIVENSKFLKLYAEAGEIITLTDSRISHCVFNDIVLNADNDWEEETYLCIGTGDAWIDFCSFSNIQMDSEGCELFHYELPKKILRKKNIATSFVNIETCSGLDEVISV